MIVVARFWVIVLCVAWLGGAGWLEFVKRDDLSRYRSPYVTSGASCSGSYKSRYECRSSRIISAENRLFLSWGKRLAVVVLPPLTLFYLFAKFARRREEEEEEKMRVAAWRKVQSRA